MRRVGLGASLVFGGLDRDALATIGIDLDAVRARIEASFGPQALTNAAQVAYRNRAGTQAPGRPPARAQLAPQAPRPRRIMAAHTAPRGPAKRPLPIRSPRAHPVYALSPNLLELAVREALAWNDSQIGVEHIALALTAIDGLVPAILSVAGASAPALRAAILDRYRQAS